LLWVVEQSSRDPVKAHSTFVTQSQRADREVGGTVRRAPRCAPPHRDRGPSRVETASGSFSPTSRAKALRAKSAPGSQFLPPPRRGIYIAREPNRRFAGCRRDKQPAPSPQRSRLSGSL